MKRVDPSPGVVQIEAGSKWLARTFYVCDKRNGVLRMRTQLFGIPIRFARIAVRDIAGIGPAWVYAGQGNYNANVVVTLHGGHQKFGVGVMTSAEETQAVAKAVASELGVPLQNLQEAAPWLHRKAWVRRLWAMIATTNNILVIVMVVITIMAISIAVSEFFKG